MIVCCGEALIDMVATPDPSGRISYRPCPGGAALNCAVALGRLGCDAALLTGLSTDFFGDQIRAHLQHSHVSWHLSKTSDNPTPLAFAKIDHGQAEYAFFNENSALGRLEAVPALPREATALVFGGISLVGGSCADLFERMMLNNNLTGLRVLDPNIRPALIRREAQYRTRLARMSVFSDVIKVSEDDLHWLNPDQTPTEHVEGFLAEGAKIVLLTQGLKGATAYSGQTSMHAPAPAVNLAKSDTIGAGDTFLAGFLSHLARVGSLGSMIHPDIATLQDALFFAVKAASLSVSRKGADPPWASEMT